MKRFGSGLAIAALLTAAVALPAGGQLVGETTVPTIVDYGEEPRQLLRYEFVEGHTDAVRFGMSMDMSMTMDGIPVADMSIPFESQIEFTVTDVLPDGSARMEFVYTAFDFGDMGVSFNEELMGDSDADADEVMDEVNDELGNQSDALVGVSGWQVVDPQGAIVDFGMDMPEAFPDDLRGQMDTAVQSVQQLPGEPVGVGARWVADMEVDSGGLPMSLTSETEVLELGEGYVVLGTSMSMDTDVLDQLMGEMPAGVEVDVAEMEMSGGAEARVELASAVAELESDVVMAMAFSMTAEEDGVTQTMDFGMDMDMHMYMEPVE